MEKELTEEEILKGNETIIKFMGIQEQEGFYEDGIGYKVKTFKTLNNIYQSYTYGVPDKSFKDFIEHSKYHVSFRWLIPALKKFNNLPPVQTFSKWNEWCNKMNMELVSSFEPLPVWKILVEAIEDYNLHLPPPSGVI